MGAEALQHGFESGLKGLYQAPALGAARGGAGGAVRGLGQGLVGVFAKNFAGVTGFASKVIAGASTSHGCRRPLHRATATLLRHGPCFA